MSEGKTQVEGGTSASRRYAVIGFRLKETFPELVFAHCDEQSLSELQCVCMVGIGVGSRETVAKTTLSQSLRHIPRAILHHAVAAGVVLFCSKSVIGAALRALVGA